MTDMSFLTQRTSSLKTAALQTVLIFLFSALVALAVNTTRHDGIPLIENWRQKAIQKHTDSGLQTVSFDEVAEKINDPASVILDARDQDLYLLGHIPGAINLPVHNFDQVFPEVSQLLPIDQPIIVYCEGFNCEMSDQLAEKLLSFGYNQVLVYSGGMEEWTSKNMPVETGPGEKTP